MKARLQGCLAGPNSRANPMAGGFAAQVRSRLLTVAGGPPSLRPFTKASAWKAPLAAAAMATRSMKLLRDGLEGYRAEDATEDPVVALAFGLVDRGVGGSFVDQHFQEVRGLELEGWRHLIFEAVETALVIGARRLAIDFGVGVGHHAVKHQEDAAADPSRGDSEVALVSALLGNGVGGFMLVSGRAEAERLPVRGHRQVGPEAPTVVRWCKGTATGRRHPCRGRRGIAARFRGRSWLPRWRWPGAPSQ